MAKRVAQMIEDQVNFWRLNHPTQPKTHPKGRKLPVITISREFGAQGLAIALMLEKRLGFKVWDKEILEVISIKLGSNVNYLEALDENAQSLVNDTIFGLLNQKGTHLNYLMYLVKAIQAIERYGSSIIVGRGGNYICDPKKALNIRLVAPLNARIAHIAKKDGLTKEKAKALILKKDEERANFTKRNFNKDIRQTSDYDLILNSASLGLEECSELIIRAYEQRVGVELHLMSV